MRSHSPLLSNYSLHYRRRAQQHVGVLRERERWADFLFSCLSVLICADNSRGSRARAAMSRSSFLLSWAAVPPPPPERPSDRIDSGSLGVARGHACLGVLPTQRATQHNTHADAYYIHTLPIPPPRRPLSSELYFYFSGPAPKKGERAEKSADENA